MNGDTRLSKALNSHPDMLDMIVSLNPRDFSRLRNDRMRKFMSPRITLRRVAAMAKIPVVELVAKVNELAGEEGESADDEKVAPILPTLPPAWMEEVREDSISWVDVTDRDDEQDDPLAPIMAAWKALKNGETMGIKHRWEPQPLYDVWEKVGLKYWAQQVTADLWHIFVHRPGDEER